MGIVTQGFSLSLSLLRARALSMNGRLKVGDTTSTHQHTTTPPQEPPDANEHSSLSFFNVGATNIPVFSIAVKNEMG